MRLLIAALLLFSPLAKAESEKILVVTANNVSQIQAYLDSGWTVKHQSISGAYYNTPDCFYCLITLSPPTPEALAKLEKQRVEESERRKAEFAKKRESFLKEQETKNKVESDTKDNK